MHSSAKGVEDKFDRLRSVVVSWDNVIDVAWVAVSINDTEYRDTETVSFSYGDVFLHHVNYEKSRWEAAEVSDATKVLFELSALTSDLELFALRKVFVSTVLFHLVDGSHLLDSLADGREVGKHTAWPAFCNVRHAY